VAGVREGRVSLACAASRLTEHRSAMSFSSWGCLTVMTNQTGPGEHHEEDHRRTFHRARRRR
jgi:hypothetical protein